MTQELEFQKIARLPSESDNSAIALQHLKAGDQIRRGPDLITLSHNTLLGHRFACATIRKGEKIFSWKVPFGFALEDIRPGEYLCNEKMLTTLRGRNVSFDLPDAPNFVDHLENFELDSNSFLPGKQVEQHETRKTFFGFKRDGARGVGTRNFIVILGTSSLTAGYAKALAEQFKNVPKKFPNIDGVVAMPHTEGASPERPNNFELLIRTLAGFMTHPNVAAILAVDRGTEYVNNARLETYLRENNYPINLVPHQFLTLGNSFLKSFEAGKSIIESWLPEADRCQRSEVSVEHLKLALQCGGSDAFSGVSANPLTGWVAREIIRNGGSAILAESPELIGAEPYILENVRDFRTAQKFLKTLDSFQERASWHGHSAAGNPSGGNLYRGLYNIIIKSIGAAMKKAPDVRVDDVIDYAERMRKPGFYFMDSPGNDLESVAGEVAAGCNIIHFTTGNGSITNFPFVPTLKFISTSERHQLLSRDMDINAGRYLAGESMDSLGAEIFQLTLETASGKKTLGEKAGHSQVQIWRDWQQTKPSHWQEILDRPQPSGIPVALKTNGSVEDYEIIELVRQITPKEKVNLIVPTSLCSGQVGQQITAKLNVQKSETSSKFVALAHTEGCGASSGISEKLFMQTLSGYIQHPSASRCLLLEHGCEKTHNDEMRNYLSNVGVDCTKLGWASIQLDGGIESVTQKISDWFENPLDLENQDSQDTSPKLGIYLEEQAANSKLVQTLSLLTKAVLSQHGSAIFTFDQFQKNSQLSVELEIDPSNLEPTIAYGQRVSENGLHLMETPTPDPSEILTGLGATGAEIILAFVSQPALSAHPLVPILQIGFGQDIGESSADFDLILETGDTSMERVKKILKLAVTTLGGEYIPKSFRHGDVNFQMTRGSLGVSM